MDGWRRSTESLFTSCSTNIVLAADGASRGSHGHDIGLLLENGADVNIQGGEFGNALQAAAVGGNDSAI
jgi:hypothetical protein